MTHRLQCLHYKVFLLHVMLWGTLMTSTSSMAAYPGMPEKDKPAYTKDSGEYTPAPELKARSGVPKGAITQHRLEKSTVFPGTAHDYWVYVPAQYRKGKPVCLMVYLDGKSWLDGEVPMSILMDNLIDDGTIPVTIALFTNAGDTGPGYPIYGGTSNRAVEYDSVNGDLARFIGDELLPRLQESYDISPDPNCRGIMGTSSGGSAAFGVAWHRPDLFGKVISVVGSFVNIRGADSFPSMVRRSERKSIRVFLQDGANDLDTIFGNWPLANQQMAAALAYQNYDYRFEFGEGGHNNHHFASLAADAMRWLWRD